jgi:hypothetical protein
MDGNAANADGKQPSVQKKSTENQSDSSEFVNRQQ